MRPALENEGYKVITAVDGLEALHLAERAHPDLIILDIEIPEPSGLAVCRTLREGGDTTPIIMLTVRDSISDLEIGFDLGASDYVTKPFDIRELLARIRARFPPRTLEIDGYLRIDILRHRVEIHRQGRWKEVDLTPREFDLLRHLVYNAGRAVGKTTLLETIFDYPDDIETKTVEKHIWALRQKLEPDPKKPRYILNIRGWATSSRSTADV